MIPVESTQLARIPSSHEPVPLPTGRMSMHSLMQLFSTSPISFLSCSIRIFPRAHGTVHSLTVYFLREFANILNNRLLGHRVVASRKMKQILYASHQIIRMPEHLLRSRLTTSYTRSTKSSSRFERHKSLNYRHRLPSYLASEWNQILSYAREEIHHACKLKHR